jgi:hypothetical protein
LPPVSFFMVGTAWKCYRLLFHMLRTEISFDNPKVFLPTATHYSLNNCKRLGGSHFFQNNVLSYSICVCSVSPPLYGYFWDICVSQLSPIFHTSTLVRPTRIKESRLYINLTNAFGIEFEILRERWQNPTFTLLLLRSRLVASVKQTNHVVMLENMATETVLLTWHYQSLSQDKN